MLYEVITHQATSTRTRRRAQAGFRSPKLPRPHVITSYSIHYTKLYDNMTVVPGQPLNAAVKKFMAREPQPLPLPEGEMLLFANTPFKPECCPNTYSNSSGCACMTGKQFNYLKTRGSNNVPYSEY